VPWTARSGNTYRLCLLDTNALSEILKRPSIEGRGFVEKYKPSAYVPCLTVYNLIELRRKPTLFEAYIDFFSFYAHFLLKPYQLILADERKANGELNSISALMQAFSPLGKDSSYQLRQFITTFFNLPEIADVEQNWRKEEKDTLHAWLKNRSNFSPLGKTANAKDAERYVKDAGLQTLINIAPHWAKGKIDAGHIPNVDNFPSLKVMLYSQYYRIFDPDWEPRPQEVADVSIMSSAPYVDVVITEKFQAEILRKVKSKVARMANLEISTLRDIRYKH